MAIFYNRSTDEIIRHFNSSSEGLTAGQVLSNRDNFGSNEIRDKKRRNLVLLFLDQFKDLLVVILIIAALVSAATGSVESAIVILFVITMNAILGTMQTVKAEKSLDSLKKLSSPEAKVIRDGIQQIIDASDLVCGDIILLEAGDIVPGDGRIIKNFSLKADESALTGESESSEKNADIIENEKTALGDQKNMVFSGTLITYGRAYAVIVAVGSETELGRIAGLLKNTESRSTPLQVSLDNFSKKLSVSILAICALVMALSIYRGLGLVDSLLFAVALAVAAIPEALSSIVTISLAIGTSRMADENAIIKKLDAVEGLGCVSVICSDKTGTLTQNKMTVQYEGPLPEMAHELHLASILCNDTKIIGGNITGDPTETALVDYYMKSHDDYNEIIKNNPRMSEVPFDSNRKLMSTIHKCESGFIMYTKGAVDTILARSSNLTDKQKEIVRTENERLSAEGLRLLGFARRKFEDNIDADETAECNLDYIGLLAEMDPPREESAKAVSDCISAGIKPIMITGDHKITASSIAKKIGIMRDGDIACTGPEIDEMSDEELSAKLDHISVYARVSPDNKIRIVKEWQKKNQIVAMTGDGVNDGPALKQADIGVAMGTTGTEVAKDSASMILTDDNFATIIKSVLNGRNIYANIKNAVLFLLSGNLAGIIAVLYASLLALPMPFTAVQLLFINLITDSLPALAIGLESPDPALINDKPRTRSEGILNRSALSFVGVTGFMLAVVTIIAFYIGINFEVPDGEMNAVAGNTMAFSVLCLGRLWHGFNCRGRESLLRLGVFTNIYSIGAFVLGALLLHLLIFVPPLAALFETSLLDAHLLLWVWILAATPTIIIQTYKWIRFR